MLQGCHVNILPRSHGTKGEPGGPPDVEHARMQLEDLRAQLLRQRMHVDAESVDMRRGGQGVPGPPSAGAEA